MHSKPRYVRALLKISCRQFLPTIAFVQSRGRRLAACYVALCFTQILTPRCNTRRGALRVSRASTTIAQVRLVFPDCSHTTEVRVNPYRGLSTPKVHNKRLRIEHALIKKSKSIARTSLDSPANKMALAAPECAVCRSTTGFINSDLRTRPFPTGLRGPVFSRRIHFRVWTIY